MRVENIEAKYEEGRWWIYYDNGDREPLENKGNIFIGEVCFKSNIYSNPELIKEA